MTCKKCEGEVFMIEQSCTMHDKITGANVWFYCGCGVFDIRDSIRHRYGVDLDLTDDSPDGSCFSFQYDERVIYVVHVKQKRDVTTLAHEVIHLIFEMFKQSQIPLAFDNQELFAMYHSYFMSEMKGYLR